MKDLFDMMAGTSTGSILATALAIPDPDHPTYPKFWASEATAIYIDSGPIIFRQSSLGRFWQVTCYITIVCLFTGLFYCCGSSRYDNKKKKEAHLIIHKFIRQNIESLRVKKQKAAYDQLEKDKSKTLKLLDDFQNIHEAEGENNEKLIDEILSSNHFDKAE